jgi:tetratricopeptide (TPR) repeat protein
VTIEVCGRYLARVDRSGSDQKAFIRTGYFTALILNGRYREAVALQRSSETPDRRFVLLYKAVFSAFISPMPLYEFELVKREALILFSETTDAYYYQNGIRWLIGIDEVTRGRLNEARNLARELMQVGQSLDDPRSIGLSFLLLSMIALASGSYAEALEYNEQSLSVAITPNEQINASGGRAWALVALGAN